jgi:hypothetical protein
MPEKARSHCASPAEEGQGGLGYCPGESHLGTALGQCQSNGVYKLARDIASGREVRVPSHRHIRRNGWRGVVAPAFRKTASRWQKLLEVCCTSSRLSFSLETSAAIATTSTLNLDSTLFTPCSSLSFVLPAMTTNRRPRDARWLQGKYPNRRPSRGQL